MSPKTELPPELGDGYELTFARLQRMFRARGASADDAADLAQETAARLLVHLRRRGLEPNPFHEGMGALIHRIAMNLLIDRARANRERAIALDEAGEIAGAEDPADVVSRTQRVRAVREAVAGLSQRHRRALSLSLDGLGPAEIAEDFGIERNAADALLYRARRRLAQTLHLDQLGVAVAIALTRIRGAARRSEVTQPMLHASPAGMQLATGLVGIAMSASLGIPTVAPATDAPASPRVAVVATEVRGAAPASVAAAASTAGAARDLAARPQRRGSVSVGANVPGRRDDGRSRVGIDVWREAHGNSTTGRLVDRGSTAACGTTSCDGEAVLR